MNRLKLILAATATAVIVALALSMWAVTIVEIVRHR